MLSLYIPFTSIEVVICNEMKLKCNYFIGRRYLYVNINLKLKPNLKQNAACSMYIITSCS